MPIVTYVNDVEDITERVKAICPRQVNDDADLDELVRSALMLVNGKLSPAGYTQEEMSVLHVWLTAHLFEIDRQRKFRNKIGKSEQYPETKIDLGLNLTRPGQQVSVLDYLHALADLTDPNGQELRRPRLFWAGTPRSAF